MRSVFEKFWREKDRVCSVGVGGCKQTELSETVLEPGQKMLGGGGLPGCELSEVEPTDLGWPGRGVWARERQQRRDQGFFGLRLV